MEGMDLASIGVSVAAVGLVTPLIVQVVKAVCKRVSWLPTLSGNTTRLVAYVLAVGLMLALRTLGLDPTAQDGVAGLLVELAAGLIGGLVSQGVYTAGKAVANPEGTA